MGFIHAKEEEDASSRPVLFNLSESMNHLQLLLKMQILTE